MFLWKNAVVLCALLAMVTLPATMLIRANWEKRYIAQLVICAMLVACLAVSFVPMLWTQLIFGLLLIACFSNRVPMAATYMFFFFWTPAAGSLLGIAGAYIAPLTPFMSFSAALWIGYLLHPEHHLRRRFVSTDAYVWLFLLIFCACVSLRAASTSIARNIATYFIPYMITYTVLSRVRIGRPELVMRLMMFAAAAAAMLCLFESIRHWPLYSGIMAVKQDLWIIDSPRSWLERGEFVRAYGPYMHPLVGGVLLAIAVIAAWSTLLARGRSGPLLVMGLVILLGLASTLSRSGLVALAVGLMVFQALRGRYLLAGLMPIVGTVAIIAFPLFAGDDVSLSGVYRLDLVVGVPRALGMHILLGYREAVQQGMLDAFIQGQGIVDLVNTYLAIVVEGGIVSLIPYLFFLFSTYPHYRAIKKMKPDKDQLLLAQALVSIQAALIVSMALLSSWGPPMQVSILAAAILISLRFDIARVRATEAPRPAPLVAIAPVYQGEQLPALK